MPQMAPMNWLTLLISFIMIFLMFNSINYFAFKYQTKSQEIKKTKNSINWKW